MLVKFVTEILKTLLGTSEDESEGTEAGTTITVERETGEGSTDEGEDEDGETEDLTSEDEDGETEDLTDEAEEFTDEGGESDETEALTGEDEDGETDGPGESVEEIRGIGPTYSDRLAGIDIETVGELAGADPAAVAAAAEVSESRATDWIERAGDR